MKAAQYQRQSADMAPRPTGRIACYLTLPFPVTLSQAFTNAKYKGRVKTNRYKEWITEARASVVAQGVEGVAGKVAVSIALTAPSKRAMDADNRLKAVLDLLTKAGMIEDDNNNYVRSIHVYWCDSKHECAVWIKPIADSEMITVRGVVS